MAVANPSQYSYIELDYMDSATSSWNKLCYINSDKVYAQRPSDGKITFTFMQPSSIETSLHYTDDLVINQLNKISFKLGDTNSDLTALVFRQKGV